MQVAGDTKTKDNSDQLNWGWAFKPCQQQEIYFKINCKNNDLFQQETGAFESVCFS